jgi:hypothetical protein
MFPRSLLSFAIGVVAGFYFGGINPAHGQTQCIPPQVVMAQALSQVQGAELILVLNGEDAQALVDKYNAEPPPTGHKVDLLLVLQAPNKVVYFIGAMNGCTVFADAIEYPMFRSWLSRGI